MKVQQKTVLVTITRVWDYQKAENNCQFTLVTCQNNGVNSSIDKK